MVQQYRHVGPEQGPAGWQLVQDSMKVGTKQVFAPANLRAAAENAAYKQLVDAFIQQRMTLRYSGGMVPDVHHILAKVWPAAGAGLGNRHLLAICSAAGRLHAWHTPFPRSNCLILCLPITYAAHLTELDG